MMFLILRNHGEPPPPFVLVMVPLLFFALSWLTNRMMGIHALYQEFPADPDDPIEENLGWLQVEFSGLRGHSPMSIKAGHRCLHMKQPFPFQPAWWEGPASIPWSQISQEKEASPSAWAFMSAAEFRLGPEGRLIRLRGRAARKLQGKVREKQGQGHGMPAAMPRIGGIRPR